MAVRDSKSEQRYTAADMFSEERAMKQTEGVRTTSRINLTSIRGELSQCLCRLCFHRHTFGVGRHIIRVFSQLLNNEHASFIVWSVKGY